MLSAPVKITINKESQVPVRDQLIEQIGLQIASGTLKSKEKLPSIRQLAQKLGIHHSTVTSAYNHLADVGLLDIRQGSGVRVASKTARSADTDGPDNNIETLFNSFLSRVAEHGYSRQQVNGKLQGMLKKSPVKRILIVDRNKDFHKLLLAELQPHFKLPVEPITYEELRDKPQLLDDSLITASLYHVHPLQSLSLDPTRFVVCNIEPGRAQLDVLNQVPSGSIVLLVSVSTTLLKMATNVAAALRGEEIAIRTVLSDDTTELQYMMKYAKAVLCDSPSEKAVKKVSGKVPVHTFQLFAPSTIALISDRLEKWG